MRDERREIVISPTEFCHQDVSSHMTGRTSDDLSGMLFVLCGCWVAPLTGLSLSLSLNPILLQNSLKYHSEYTGISDLTWFCLACLCLGIIPKLYLNLTTIGVLVVFY